jgi:threonine/homoserine/homoserine lactone efflux protein
MESRLVLAASALAFHTIKFAGTAYLVWLGIRTIRARNVEFNEENTTRGARAFRQGVLTEILNPKTALFFLSFIPQFVTPALGHIFLRFVLLGSLSVALKTCADIVVVFLSGRLGRELKSSGA